jgi:hypothetical protein
MQSTINPYPIIGTQLTSGLDAIANALSTKSTVDDLVNAIYNYIQPIYYPKVSGIIETEIKSVAYNVINTYINNTFCSAVAYNASQDYFISLLLCATSQKPVNTIDQWLLNVEDNIGKCGLSIDEQTPLLLATVDGKSAYNYWMSIVQKPGKWSKFLNENVAINYANIPFWTEECMEGALIGANASPRGLISPTTDITSVEIISSLIGALAIGAGVVIFKWLPKINCNGNVSPIVDTKVNTGGGSFTWGSGGTTHYSADYVTKNTIKYYY